MSDSETWQSVVKTDVTGRHFTKDVAGVRSEGTMQAIEVDDASGYTWFIDSDGNRVFGCTQRLGQVYFLSDGGIHVGVPNAGALTIDAA